MYQTVLSSLYQFGGAVHRNNYEQLAKNDQYIYVLSHANGDFPSELPSWITTLNEIKDNFSVPMAEKYYKKIN